MVCARNRGRVDLHSHRNAQLSAIFYVLTDLVNGSGELEFEPPDDYFSHVMTIPYRDTAASGGVFARCPTVSCCSLRTCIMGCFFMREAAFAIRFPTIWPSSQCQAREARCEYSIRWIGCSSAAKDSA